MFHYISNLLWSVVLDCITISIIKMKIRDDEILRPMQYERFLNSVKRRTTNDVDSGIDY